MDGQYLYELKVSLKTIYVHKIAIRTLTFSGYKVYSRDLYFKNLCTLEDETKPRQKQTSYSFFYYKVCDWSILFMGGKMSFFTIVWVFPNRLLFPIIILITTLMSEVVLLTEQ